MLENRIIPFEENLSETENRFMRLVYRILNQFECINIRLEDDLQLSIYCIADLTDLNEWLPRCGAAYWENEKYVLEDWQGFIIEMNLTEEQLISKIAEIIK